MEFVVSSFFFLFHSKGSRKFPDISIKHRSTRVNYFILSQAEKLIEAWKIHLLCIHENLLLNCATEKRKQHQIELFLSLFHFLMMMMKNTMRKGEKRISLA